jgi:hypothetical protein
MVIVLIQKCKNVNIGGHVVLDIRRIFITNNKC